jgi:hypothetical protein
MDIVTSSPSSRMKLKDSCDLCSAAKVRCTKEKPACKRCSKFGYRCFYSPARRVGRPYRPCTTQSVVTTPPESMISQKQDDDTSVPASSQQPCLGLLQSSTLTERVPDWLSGSAHNPTTIPSTGNHTKSPLKTTAPVSIVSAADADCACAGLDILEKLMFSSEGLYGGNDNSLADTRSSLSIAKKLICRILICPCSQRSDIILLLPAICHMMLDLIEKLDQKIKAMDQLRSEIGQVTQELRNVTALVLQLSNRFNGQEDGGMVNPMPSLILSLRSRLHNTIDKAMDFSDEFNMYDRAYLG